MYEQLRFAEPGKVPGILFTESIDHPKTSRTVRELRSILINRLEDADDLGLFFQMGQILCHAPNLAEILVLV